MFAPGAIVGLQAICLGVRVDAHTGTTAWTRVVNLYGDDARRTACFRAEPGHPPAGGLLREGDITGANEAARSTGNTSRRTRYL